MPVTDNLQLEMIYVKKYTMLCMQSMYVIQIWNKYLIINTKKQRQVKKKTVFHCIFQYDIQYIYRRNEIILNKQGTDVTKGIVIIATQASDEDKNKLNTTLTVNNDNGKVRTLFSRKKMYPPPVEDIDFF